MRRLLIGLMVLAFAVSAMGQSYWMKSGDTVANNRICSVLMTKITDGTTAPEIVEDTIDVTYWGSLDLAAATTYTDTADVALTDAWTSKGMKYIAGGMYRFDPPAAALDGGIGSTVTFYLYTATYEGHVIIHLGAPVNAYLSDGSTPPTQAALVAATWGALTADNTTSGSFGEAVGNVFSDWTAYFIRMYSKVMSLRK